MHKIKYNEIMNYQKLSVFIIKTTNFAYLTLIFLIFNSFNTNIKNEKTNCFFKKQKFY